MLNCFHVLNTDSSQFSCADVCWLRTQQLAKAQQEIGILCPNNKNERQAVNSAQAISRLSWFNFEYFMAVSLFGSIYIWSHMFLLLCSQQ